MVGFQHLCTQEFKLLLNSLSLVFWGVNWGRYLSGFPVVWPRTFMANSQLTVGFWWFQSCGTWLFNILYGLYPYLGPVGTFEDGTGDYIIWQVWAKSLLALDLSPVTSPENFLFPSLLSQGWMFKAEAHSLQQNQIIIAATYEAAIGEGTGDPLQYSCLENPVDGEAW